MIDTCRERIYSTPMFDPEISNYTQAVGELKEQGLSNAEVEVDRGLPSIAPLSIVIAAATSIRKLSDAVTTGNK